MLTGCAKYCTRVFLLSGQAVESVVVKDSPLGEHCGRFLIRPSVWAYVNTFGAEDDHTFGVSLIIDDTASESPFLAERAVRNIFSPDTMSLTFYPGKERVYLTLDTEQSLSTFSRSGHGLIYVSRSLTIPPTVESLLVSVDLNTEPDSASVVHCESVEIKLYRYEDCHTSIYIP
jgi:hypothetical protein